MHFGPTIKVAVQSLKRNKSRSALTILGIVIGIASVMMMLSLGQGAQALILSEVASFGSDTVFMEPGAGDQSGPPIGIDLTILKLEDAERLERLPFLELVSPVIWRDASVVYGDEDKVVRIIGTTPNELELNKAFPEVGRFFDESEVRSRARVAVLGKEAAEDIFESEDPLGKTIRIQRTTFKVIGVLEERGTQFFQNLDDQIYIPVTTAAKTVFGVDYYTFITARSLIPIDEAVDELRWQFREWHNIDNPEGDLSKDDVRVGSQVEATEIVGTVTLTLTALLASIAAISLVVGGIGIMNIMLVSVTERTREIGLRKAVGARNKDILTQFLAESVLLTLFGGIVGVLVGLLFSYASAVVARQFVDGWDFVVPVMGIVLGFSVAAVVGIVFGLYPAKKASKLDPIDALRRE